MKSRRWVTYILEDKSLKREGQGARRYYIGRSTRFNERMEEHEKDGRRNYQLVYLYFGDIEKKLKRFGATKFMNLPERDKFCLTDSFMNITRLSNQ